MYLAEWIKGWRVEDLFRAGQAQRICFAPVFTMAQLARQEQLHARHFFIDVTHSRAGTLTHLGAPYQLHEPWWQIRRPAPLLGEHNQELFSALTNTQHEARNTQTQSLIPAPNTQHSTPRLPLEG